MTINRVWKREYDGMIARSLHGKTVHAMYGASAIDIKDVVDVDGEPVANYAIETLACITAAIAAKGAGLIQAWSLAQGLNGFSCMMVRFDGSAARNLETTPAGALCWLLLEICQRRN